jgi:hypothetical protein
LRSQKQPCPRLREGAPQADGALWIKMRNDRIFRAEKGTKRVLKSATMIRMVAKQADRAIELFGDDDAHERMRQRRRPE